MEDYIMNETTITIDKVFAEEVKTGLNVFPKYLPTRFIYDDNGDKIFQQIMELPEYYLTRSELEIFRFFKSEIVSTMLTDGPFNLVELGAGDCLKTKILLQELQSKKADFVFTPVDISANAIEILAEDLREEFPDLKIKPLQAEYFKALERIKKDGERLIVLFLGSNLGNFRKSKINQLVSRLSTSLSEKDLLFLGVDLVKDPLTILHAYDDSQNITAAFNKNLLIRINNELGGQFNPDMFYFYPNYDPEDGAVKSYLVSSEDQAVYIEALNEVFNFKQGETIFTEISQKFCVDYLEELKHLGNFRQIGSWTDHRAYFKNLLWQKNS
jgi:L-histidine N-alpha-methyltransferase